MSLPLSTHTHCAYKRCGKELTRAQRERLVKWCSRECAVADAQALVDRIKSRDFRPLRDRAGAS